MPQPTPRSFMGIAKEATKGTGVAASNYIPVRTFNPKDVYKYIDDLGMRGSMVKVYNVVQGVVQSQIEFGGDAFSDSIGWPLFSVLGAADFTAGPPNIHTMAVKNTTDGQATGQTISDTYIPNVSANTRQFPGAQCSEVAFRFNADGLLEYTARYEGFKSAVVANPTASFTALVPMAAWRGVTTIGGSGNLNLQTGELTIKRQVSAIFNVSGSQSPKSVWQGPVEVDGRATFIMEDDTELTRYLTNTPPIFLLAFSQGAGGTAELIQFTMTKCAYVVGEPVRSKDYVECNITFKGIANTTDANTAGTGQSPIKVVLNNAMATGSYG
jgi:hypothetical protein